MEVVNTVSQMEAVTPMNSQLWPLPHIYIMLSTCYLLGVLLFLPSIDNALCSETVAQMASVLLLCYQ